MAISNHGDRFSLKADASLTTAQYCLIKRTGPQSCDLATAATDNIVGVLYNKPRIGETAEVVRITGGSSFKLKAGATISAGVPVTAGTGGKAVAATAGQRGVARFTADVVDTRIEEAEGADTIVPE